VKAHHKAYVRRKDSKYQPMKIIKNNALRELIEYMLYDDQSPPNIADRINKRERYLPSISKDSIYRYIKSIYGRQIEIHRTNKRSRRRKRRIKNKQLQDRTFIDKRPQIINKRERLGDIESDFIESGKTGKGMILVAVDRKTRASFLERIVETKIYNVHKAFVRIKKRFPEIKTITTDNDILLKKHKELARLLNVKIYFCHPYHSWEKGTVENANKYIRKDIPKSSDVSKYSKRFIQKLEDKLNRRSLRCLDSMTPNETVELEREKINNKKTASGRYVKEKVWCSD